jgi:hypothetical protein
MRKYHIVITTKVSGVAVPEIPAFDNHEDALSWIRDHPDIMPFGLFTYDILPFEAEPVESASQ